MFYCPTLQNSQDFQFQGRFFILLLLHLPPLRKEPRYHAAHYFAPRAHRAA